MTDKVNGKSCILSEPTLRGNERKGTCVAKRRGIGVKVQVAPVVRVRGTKEVDVPGGPVNGGGQPAWHGMAFGLWRRVRAGCREWVRYPCQQALGIRFRILSGLDFLLVELTSITLLNCRANLSL